MTIEDKIREEPLYILCIENPTLEQIKIAIHESGPELVHLFLNDDLFEYFCNDGGFEEISLVKNLNGLSESKMREIIFADYRLIEKIESPSEKLQILAVNRNPEAILLIDNASIKAWNVAVHKKPELIDYFYQPPQELQLIAVTSDVKSIKYIDEPTKKVQLYVARLGPENIANIKNIHPDVACECIKRYGLSVFIFLKRTDEQVLNLIRDKLKNM